MCVCVCVYAFSYWLEDSGPGKLQILPHFHWTQLSSFVFSFGDTWLISLV